MWHPPQFETTTARQANEYNHQPLNDVRLPEFDPQRSIGAGRVPNTPHSRNPNIRVALDGRVGSMSSAVGSSRADYIDSFKPPAPETSPTSSSTVNANYYPKPSISRPDPGAFLNLPGVPAQFVGCAHGVHDASTSSAKKTDIIVGTQRLEPKKNLKK